MNIILDIIEVGIIENDVDDYDDRYISTTITVAMFGMRPIADTLAVVPVAFSFTFFFAWRPVGVWWPIGRGGCKTADRHNRRNDECCKSGNDLVKT